MKFFSRSLLSWNEPYFFVLRMRTKSDWTRKLIWMIIVSVGICAIMLADYFWGRGAGRGSLPLRLLAGTGIGCLLVAIRDLVWTQRSITIDKETVTAFANAGMMHALTSIRTDTIASVSLQRATEIGRPFGLLTIFSTGGFAQIGVPKSVREEKIAQVFHDLSIQIDLDDWEPENRRKKSTEPVLLEDIEKTAPTATAFASIHVIDQDVSRRVLNRTNIILCNVISLTPLVLGLAGALTAWIYVWLQRGNLSGLQITGIVVGGFASMVLPFVFVATYGEYIPSRWFLRLMRNRVWQRPDAVATADDQDSRFVEVVPRANWGKIMLMTTSDTGFLRVTGSGIRFEGDIERWEIPVNSILGCQVEKVSKEIGAPQKDDGMFSYYVVLQAKVAEGLWEAPIMLAQTLLEGSTNVTRERNAHQLRDSILQQFPDSRRAHFYALQASTLHSPELQGYSAARAGS